MARVRACLREQPDWRDTPAGPRRARARLVWLLHADKSQVHLAYAGGRSVDGFWNGAIVLPIALVISGLVVLATKGISADRRRRQFRLLPRTSARIGSGSSVRMVVIEHAVPAAHCLPGRKGRSLIVFTSAARANLTSTEVEAALEHERAHLRCGHHRMVLVADSVAAILAWTGALRSYPAQVRRLVELDADDVAVRRFGNRTVASALLAMCTPPPGPESVVRDLSFSGSGAAIRIRRLLENMAAVGESTAADRPRTKRPDAKRSATSICTRRSMTTPAYTEELLDEKGATAAAFWARAAKWFRRHGIKKITRVLTDNGSCYRSFLFAAALATSRTRHKRTRPYRPQTNGKVCEDFVLVLHRTMATEWIYVQPWSSNEQRRQALAGRLDYYNHERAHSSLRQTTDQSLPGRCHQPRCIEHLATARHRSIGTCPGTDSR